jgi:hypothetical protein
LRDKQQTLRLTVYSAWWWWWWWYLLNVVGPYFP